jgi:hypothetical protein
MNFQKKFDTNQKLFIERKFDTIKIIIMDRNLTPTKIFSDIKFSLTLGISKLKTSLEAPKPIFRLDFEHLFCDDYTSDQSLASLFDKQKVRFFLII